MSFEIEKTFPRLWSLNRGHAMIVTDLHGDWEFYQFYRDHFLKLKSQNSVDCLIITGDLIHSDSDTSTDDSLKVVLDVMALQQTYGDSIICLCGNHELPHILGFGLSKGGRDYTPAFEAALSKSGKRSEVVNFLMSLPFYIRTKSGVSITHAGATPAVTDSEIAKILFEWSHAARLLEGKKQLDEVDKESIRRAFTKLSGFDSYDKLADYYFSITDRHDPRYDDLLVGLMVTSQKEYQYLHSALFTKCEHEIGAAFYESALDKMLQILSTDYWQQSILLAGHITVEHGYEIVAKHHFRLASGAHAKPKESAKFLVFDVERKMEDVFCVTTLFAWLRNLMKLFMCYFP